MARPTVSALVKCRNEELFLAECIRSIQPFVDEIVFIDNNSTDNSLEIARSFPITIVQSPANPGGDVSLADYYNWCTEQTTCDYVIKWDADLVALENYGEVVALLDERPAAIAYTMHHLRGDHRHVRLSHDGLDGPEPYLYSRTLRHVPREDGLEDLVVGGPSLRYEQPVALHMDIKSDERYVLRSAITVYRRLGLRGITLEEWARRSYEGYDKKEAEAAAKLLTEVRPYEGTYPAVLDSYLANPKWLIEYDGDVPVRRVERW